MSVVDEAEAAIGAVTGASWWRLALKLAPWVAIAALAVGLQLTRSTLMRVRLEHKVEFAKLDASAARATAANADRVARAADTYATRVAALQPLIVRSTNEVTRYAETPAGRVLCRDADRVRSIDVLDETLRAAPAAAGGADTVQLDAPAPPAGR